MSRPELWQPSVHQYAINGQWTSAGGNDNNPMVTPRRKTQGLNDTGTVRQKFGKYSKFVTVLYGSWLLYPPNGYILSTHTIYKNRLKIDENRHTINSNLRIMSLTDTFISK